MTIKHTIQVRPRAANPNISFIDPPGTAGTAKVSAFEKLRCVELVEVCLADFKTAVK